ncbi:23S rRNA pseudouridine(1911/1915/1917) synthase RluD [Blochmannia endosymbiont of Colobopsis nipponica]|uniref:23S rRNA pseudouridine(1911/1915/1917) synthase RluD n=1 Tax=Blochmannia endosymbiont of Colobopsis nipponica TaxID=2681987 RepID=UPI00177C1A95|nr:23S rRNA pseudouridine(1911/1915/1917) synthase RluD [Blochmannia endosymbiont of Colobopsis nipponica]QOI11230.1 23S rRNA pseudouridine(1911/1915/1917) synthase RluD [Blochmannia endosymbiont of Colobopsis nipponica]
MDVCKNNQYFINRINKSQSGRRLDQALVCLFPSYSRSQIKKMILSGNVKLNKKIVFTPDKKVFFKEQVEIHVANVDSKLLQAQNIALNIIFEDPYLMVINKPCNLVVHPGAGNPSGTILNALLYYFPDISEVPRSGIVHRLDKDTTGLMVIAKRNSVRNKLIELFKSRNIKREYEAIVFGILSIDGTIDQPISRHLIKRTCMMVHRMGKFAVTNYRVVENFRFHTRLRLYPNTGRTHQIRVHMSYINHPLVGDQKYGRMCSSIRNASDSLNRCLLNFNRQALHAISLQFHHPITHNALKFETSLPRDFEELIYELKNDRDVKGK